jgi:ABC-type glutathione transport system ATPase component
MTTLKEQVKQLKEENLNLKNRIREMIHQYRNVRGDKDGSLMRAEIEKLMKLVNYDESRNRKAHEISKLLRRKL